MARAPFGKLSRQHTPLAATLEHIRHAAEDLIQIHCAWAGFLSCPLQNWEKLLELLTTDVAWITLAQTPSSYKEDVYHKVLKR